MNVLFVCTANGGRSVMAERLFRREATADTPRAPPEATPATAPTTR